ncbi:NAC family transcription factor [Methanoculleus sp. FWC-SCC1]|uniref:NAC family transcription factor n=1 Tax=Methanoculleus frigidifontis TaxID=2584085 RepID=A0ABT8M8V4_9EURY|nr:NAC family transcription factor [Methanoculleus sp. FWC-SCC1]MDN7024344.1 NAC family transcription factor [Methanoculleus sp. FWC-SCC1]
MTNEKEGDYCTVCGGIRPDAITTKTILVDGRETGINRLDEIIAGVRKLNLTDTAAIRENLLKAVQECNYVPTKKMDAYADAILQEYRNAGE